MDNHQAGEPRRFTTVDDNWQHFDAVDIPPNAPEIQRSEMKRAFMAGVSSGMVLAMYGFQDGNFMQALVKINAELMTFSTLQKAGARGHG